MSHTSDPVARMVDFGLISAMVGMGRTWVRGQMCRAGSAAVPSDTEFMLEGHCSTLGRANCLLTVAVAGIERRLPSHWRLGCHRVWAHQPRPGAVSG